jgi:DNA gyrase/topoisomerase IV subunit B
MVIERSALIDVVDGVSLKDYYTVETPDSNKYPTAEDGTPLDTYVNAIATDAKGYKERANKIKSSIKSFDPRIDDRIFEKLVALLNVQIHNEELKNELKAYLDNEKVNAEYDAEQKMLNAWDEWLNFLQAQAENRTENRLVDEACAIAFREAGSAPEYQDGGICNRYV